MKLKEDDLRILKEKGISPERLEKQLSVLNENSFMQDLLRPASLNDGIALVSDGDKATYISLWEDYLRKEKKVEHFIPASGSTDRFFRELVLFRDQGKKEPTTVFERLFFRHLPSFAFWGELNEYCREHEGKTIQKLLEDKQYSTVIECMLSEGALNYGKLPSALFKFHTDKSKRFVAIQRYLPKKFVKYYASFEDTRTPIQESLIESAIVSGVRNGVVDVTFTISKEDEGEIRSYLKQFVPPIEKKLSIKFNIQLPYQSSATDSVVLKENNDFFRGDNKQLMFQHAGHGTLFNQFNDVASRAKVVFIKNMDNVAVDTLKRMAARHKKMLAGYLLKTQNQINTYLTLLDTKRVPDNKLLELIFFVQNTLNIKRDDILSLPKEEQLSYLFTKLHRPLRICGMVKNEDEIGGVPFWVKDADGTSSLQIVEHGQTKQNNKYKEMFAKATHFNPVDIVCSTVDYKNKNFDLSQYTDNQNEIIVDKELEDAKVKFVEASGLWNGKMANWNTVFIEVPIKTFNPVKNINDLLRLEHQNT